MIDNYAYVFYHLDDRNTLSQIILRILSYCDDNKRYIAARTLAQIILQVQSSLNLIGYVSLVTKLSRKYKNVTRQSSTWIHQNTTRLH